MRAVSDDVPDWRDATALTAWTSSLLNEVATLLDVPPRAVTVELRRDAEHVAQTRQRWPPAVPVVIVSPDSLRADVLAHELAHSLVPSRWLLLAEGLATWAGCKVGASCDHLWFAERTLEEVLRRHWLGHPSPSEMAEETVCSPRYLDPGRFHLFETRIAYAVAGSFCGFWASRHRDLGRSAAAEGSSAPAALLRDLSALPLAEMEACWRSHVLEGGPPSGEGPGR